MMKTKSKIRVEYENWLHRFNDDELQSELEKMDGIMEYFHEDIDIIAELP